MNIKILESNENPERRPVTFADLEVGDMFLIECFDMLFYMDVDKKLSDYRKY